MSNVGIDVLRICDKNIHGKAIMFWLSYKMNPTRTWVSLPEKKISGFKKIIQIRPGCQK
jgi:hypothetical protein